MLLFECHLLKSLGVVSIISINNDCNMNTMIFLIIITN